MAWPGTLTEQEQTIIMAFVDELFRPNILRLVQAINISRGIKIAWDSQIQELLTKLVNSDVIPTNTNLSGASVLTKQQITSLLVDLNTFLTTYDAQSQRDKYITVIGAPNMVRE